jgi:hypothetical protein
MGKSTVLQAKHLKPAHLDLFKVTLNSVFHPDHSLLSDFERRVSQQIDRCGQNGKVLTEFFLIPNWPIMKRRIGWQ